MSEARRRYLDYFLTAMQAHRSDPAWFESEWPQIERAWNAGQQWGDTATMLGYLNTALPSMAPLGLWTTAIAWITAGLPWVQEAGNKLREGVLLEDLGSPISCVVSEKKRWRSTRRHWRLLKHIRTRSTQALFSAAEASCTQQLANEA